MFHWEFGCRKDVCVCKFYQEPVDDMSLKTSHVHKIICIPPGALCEFEEDELSVASAGTGIVLKEDVLYIMNS